MRFETPALDLEGMHFGAKNGRRASVVGQGLAEERTGYATGWGGGRKFLSCSGTY